MVTRVVLISCVKKKRDSASPARDLYLSQLFLGLRHYAEIHADTWYILSAEHGILRPEQVIEPYERTLKKMSKRERLTWAGRVQRQLLELLPAGADVILLAGLRYREEIVILHPPLAARISAYFRALIAESRLAKCPLPP